MYSLDGKVAIVTGASGGIGRESATRLASEGASVVVADVDEEGGRETVDHVVDDGGEATFVHTDVTDDADVAAMVEETVDTYGGLDIAHNNAGVLTEMGPLTELTEEEWDMLLSVNTKGVWLGLKHELPVMAEHGGGSIVNTGSEAGLIGFPMAAGYVASKHGVVGLTKTAALEYADDGVRVNAVCPGPIETPMTDGLSDENRSAQIEDIPMSRMGQPEEIANAVAWLCSEEASFVTGHPLSVDGGRVSD